MKKTTLERCVATLGEEWGDAAHEVTVPPTVRERALATVERMIS